ncbi:MAG: PepSY domain-containing protein [Burkholderiaceae bacterium]|jgi:uncharacterized membrane protein YkoI|nr:PepSY domain-containing protein [Burkholderiaceae bacterium]MCU0964643.1 PepSY domain-containing protein [Burkholderiaceae bacterium]
MHRSILSRWAPALAALVLGTASAIAVAQAPAAPAASAAAMNFQQVVERVVAQGYNDVREVERKSDKLYEIKARDSQGRWVELYVDARNGEILREEVKR